VTEAGRARPRTPSRARTGARYATLAGMVVLVVIVSGLFAMAYGSWRGFVAARSALVPLLRDGDPTRTLIESGRPIHARVRVRLALRQVAVAFAWLTVAMYGMYLATAGAAMAS
jgi:hypothetical protein